MECDCYNEDFAKTDNGTFAVGIADKMFRYEVKDAPEQGTDKWLEWRKQGITATEAASIMYPSKWGSPLSIYTDKLGLTQKSQDDSDGFMEWGHRIEDLLVSKFMEQHKGFTACAQGRLYQRDWAKCSLDAQCFDESGAPVIIECKTGQHEEKWDPIPERYYAQVQWQMHVTGVHKCFFAVLLNGCDYFEREVDYDPHYCEELEAACLKLWECVKTKTPPPASTLDIELAMKASPDAAAKVVNAFKSIS
jgi:putative phage-type endonuclease